MKLTFATAAALLLLVPTSLWAQDDRDAPSVPALKVFVVDEDGNETELTSGYEFIVDGFGGPGTVMRAEFTQAAKNQIGKKLLRLKRGGLTLGETQLQVTMENSGSHDFEGKDVQDAGKELQRIHLSEWEDLREYHDEEIADLQEFLNSPDTQDDLRKQKLDEMQKALTRHARERNILTARHEQERERVQSFLGGNAGEASAPPAGGEAPVVENPAQNPPAAGNNFTVSQLLSLTSNAARSVSREARGRFSDFATPGATDPGAPVSGNTAADPTPPLTRAEEDARQEHVRAIWVIGHFDKVEQETFGVYAAAAGPATPANGREVSGFPTPRAFVGDVEIHPSLASGGTAIEFPKFTREIPKMIVAQPTAISPGPLNTEELRRSFSPSAWGQLGVGQVFHGIAPEYWQHPNDWDLHPTMFFDMTIESLVADVLGVPGKETELWGYNGLVPGPAYILREREPVVIRNHNHLAHDRSTHLHGGHSPAHSDGSPHFTVRPGQSRDYYYPNIPPRLRDRNLSILQRTAETGEDYMTAANALGIPIYISKDGSAPAGDDPPAGWPNDIEGKPARIQRVLGPLGGLAGDEWDTSEFSDTLWYHDHAMDETGPGAYSGLAGTYTLTDPLVEDLMRRNVIPSLFPKVNPDANGVAQSLDFSPARRGGPDTDFNTYHTHLCMSDKVFNPDGSLFYDILNHNGQMGDVTVVNGIANPKFTVEKRKYRFGILWHGNARAVALQVRTADHRMAQPLMQIGYDTWLYPKPIKQDFWLGMPAKRADVIIDFGALAAQGIREVYLENILPQVDGRGPRGTANVDQLIQDGTVLADGEPGERFIKFIITDEPVHGGKPDLNITYNTPLRPHLPIREDEIVKTRIFSFHRQNGAWKINSTFFDRDVANATPAIGTAERWIIRNNGGGWWHPIHIHLEGHQWQSLNGGPVPLRDRFKQDTVILGSGDEVEIFMKYRTWLGSMVFHCHNLEHEDMRMMFNIDSRVIPTIAPQETQNTFP